MTFSAQNLSPKINKPNSKIIKNVTPSDMILHGNPAKKRRIVPEMNNKIDVPKSGCRKTRINGNKNSNKINNQSRLEFKPSDFCTTQAKSNGNEIFNISEGCYKEDLLLNFFRRAAEAEPDFHFKLNLVSYQ